MGQGKGSIDPLNKISASGGSDLIDTTGTLTLASGLNGRVAVIIIREAGVVLTSVKAKASGGTEYELTSSENGWFGSALAENDLIIFPDPVHEIVIATGGRMAIYFND